MLRTSFTTIPFFLRLVLLRHHWFYSYGLRKLPKSNDSLHCFLAHKQGHPSVTPQLTSSLKSKSV